MLLSESVHMHKSVLRTASELVAAVRAVPLSVTDVVTGDTLAALACGLIDHNVVLTHKRKDLLDCSVSKRHYSHPPYSFYSPVGSVTMQRAWHSTNLALL